MSCTGILQCVNCHHQRKGCQLSPVPVSLILWRVTFWQRHWYITYTWEPYSITRYLLSYIPGTVLGPGVHTYQSFIYGVFLLVRLCYNQSLVILLITKSTGGSSLTNNLHYSKFCTLLGLNYFRSRDEEHWENWFHSNFDENYHNVDKICPWHRGCLLL